MTLTISLSHNHSKVLHSSISIAKPAAVKSKIDGGLGNQHLFFVHSYVWRWLRGTWVIKNKNNKEKERESITYVFAAT